jgi:hypothetical protein
MNECGPWLSSWVSERRPEVVTKKSYAVRCPLCRVRRMRVCRSVMAATAPTRDGDYGLCARCGVPMKRGKLATRPVSERLAERLTPDRGCLIFTGSLNNNGYGWIGIGRKLFMAHRVAYELAKGPIPEGLEVMHACNRPACCNPDHLSLGTHAENMAQARKQYCKWGHPLEGENLYTSPAGKRDCWACIRRRSAARSSSHDNSKGAPIG